MLKQLGVNRDHSDRHAEVLDVAEFVGESGEQGSATNVLVNMARESRTFRRTVESPDFQAWRSRRKQAEAEPANGRKSK